MTLPLAGLGDLVFGCLLVVFGLAALALSLLRYRRLDPMLGSFGAFVLLYGARLVAGGELAQG